MENRQVLSTNPASIPSEEHSGWNRRTISYVLFALGLLFLLAGSFSSVGAVGLIVGLAAVLVGLVFYRRSK